MIAPLRRLTDVDRVPFEEAFLISDLLTTRITFLTGEPKAGKSLFAAGMLRALIEGHEEFIGQRVFRRVNHVVYGYTDDGGDIELRERFHGTPSLDHISYVSMHNMKAEDWAELVPYLRDAEADMFVLDTVLGSLATDDDIASSTTAQVVVSRVRPVAEAGIPVLLITHTPKGNAEGLTIASSVIGGRAMAGGARGVIALRRDRNGRRVQTSINRAAEDLNIAVRVRRQSDESEVPIWELAQASKATAKSGEAVDELVTRLLKEQPEETSINALAEMHAPGLGMGLSTLRGHLSKRVRHDGDAWTSRAA